MAIISLGKDDLVTVIINGKHTYYLEEDSKERTLFLKDISVAKYDNTQKTWFVVMKSGKIYEVHLYHSAWFQAQFPTFPYSANYTNDLLAEEFANIKKDIKKIKKYLKKIDNKP